MNDKSTIKWPEIFSLAGLNIALAISWIAYHEYQPFLISEFGLTDLAGFLVLAKGIILVIIPPFSGWLADLILRKNGKYFTLFTVGIGSASMIFMVVASIISAGPLSAVKPFLPFMIVLWLIAMNLFTSPANSMIQAFAPSNKLPIVMGVLFFATELVYALEPLVVGLVQFFGDTLTFIVGGVLIAGTGILFQKVSSNEVKLMRDEIQEKQGRTSRMMFPAIIMVGLILGLSKAFIIEYLPNYLSANYVDYADYSKLIIFFLLGIAALLGLILSSFITRFELTSVILIGVGILAVGACVIFTSSIYSLTIIGAILVAVSFSLLNISGLPFAIKHLSIRNITYGVGIYIGASEVFSGILENL